MDSDPRQGFSLRRQDDFWIASFQAMASPCELHLKLESRSEADQLASLAFLETRRIERKFSRYRDDNIIHRINTSNGEVVKLDDETTRLISYADKCYKLSEGLFDITSGVLRSAWRFDGSAHVPDQALIGNLRKLVGWDKVLWTGRTIQLLPGMEIDLGGIGKEYAVDTVALRLISEARIPIMVNYGGDIHAHTPPDIHHTWRIGIEDPHLENSPLGRLEFRNRAIATSGDTRRYCMVDGKRLGHLLNPQTGWPVEGAPRSVTATAALCTEAGILSTIAMLHGRQAEAFLKARGVVHYCRR